MPQSLAPKLPGFRDLWTLAWPIVLARSTQSVVGLADALMCAPLGDDALAAATTGSLNTFSFVILPMGVAFIVQSFSAQYTGRGEPLAARRYAWYGLLLGALAMLAALATLPVLPRLLGLFHYGPRVDQQILGYMQYRVPSAGVIVATEALGNWFAGTGDTRIQMRAGVVTMVTNILFNWLLIYGHFGLPAMGVRGAALASALASLVGFLFVARAFAIRQREVAAGAPLGLRVDEFMRMLRFGIPNGLNWFMEFGAFILFINAVVTSLGTPVLAAFNVIIQINSVSFMPAFGLASAGAILVGQAIGRGEKDLVPGLLKRAATVTLAWQGSVGLIYLLAPKLLLSAFAREDGSGGEMLRVGAVMLALSGTWQLFDALGLTVGEALRAAGDTAWCMWARLGVAWALFLPLGWLSVVKLSGGHVAAILCVVLYLAVLAVAFVWRFRSGAWRKIELTGEVGVG